MELQFNMGNINVLQSNDIDVLITNLDKDLENKKCRSDKLADYIDKLIIGILIHSPNQFKSLPILQKILKAQTNDRFTINRKIIDRCLPTSNSSGNLIKIPINEITETTKRFPKENVKGFLEVVNKLSINQEEKNQVIADWINFQHIPFSKLNFSHEQLKSILPKISHLILDLGEISEKKVNEYLSICKNLEFLNLTNNKIKSISITNNNLNKLEIYSDSLIEIKNLNGGLKSLFCSCQNLDTLPGELPKTLETLTFLECEKLEKIPKLNPYLKNFKSLNCPEMRFPEKIEAKLNSFEVIKHPLQRLPILPQGVTSITCSECPNLFEITSSSLPNTVITLDVSNCENLETIAPFYKKIKNFYFDGCEKFQSSKI